jgi:fatty acid-binding protein DegV
LCNIYISQISPALGVHTGPGLLGVAYRVID